MLRWPFPQTQLTAGELRLERWDTHKHADLLWRALEDPAVWQFAPKGAPADITELTRRLGKRPGGRDRITWVVFQGDEVIGTTSHFRAGEDVEIGASYMAPQTWSTGMNLRVKRIMVDAARENGCAGIVLRADDADVRANKAIQRIGAEFTHKCGEQMLRPDGTRRVSRFYHLDNDTVL
ncbi:GNAT family N-acetyltransferase [Propionibacterium sp.]|uniref:GNAT family N-acetyltransferase n=1 Tax=Propionibacterium sp. TaxID=1977903 RepID=UPI0039EB8CB0